MLCTSIRVQLILVLLQCPGIDSYSTINVCSYIHLYTEESSKWQNSILSLGLRCKVSTRTIKCLNKTERKLLPRKVQLLVHLKLIWKPSIRYKNKALVCIVHLFRPSCRPLQFCICMV